MAQDENIQEVAPLEPVEKRAQEGVGKSAQATGRPLQAQAFSPGDLPAPNTPVVQPQATSSDGSTTSGSEG